MTSSDQLVHLHFPKLGVKGAYVQLDQSLGDLPAYAGYPTGAQALLGQALAAAALLHANVKGRSRISVQLQSRSALRLLYGECSEEGGLRGLAQLTEGSDAPALDQLGASAVLAITLESRSEQNRSGTRYQGLVPITSARLDQALEHYFATSEQLPTVLVLAADGSRARGLLLQKMPLDEHPDAALLDPDGWNRTSMLIGTLGPNELLEADRGTILRRLFHEETLQLVDGLQLRFACTCSRERVESMFRSLGREEAMAALAESGLASVRCEFCDRDYRFDRIDLEAVFHPLTQPGSTVTQ